MIYLKVIFLIKKKTKNQSIFEELDTADFHKVNAVKCHMIMLLFFLVATYIISFFLILKSQIY
jgi:hypothetical protein